MICLVPSVSNLRDLGGLPTGDGRVTAHGRVYRSSNFSEIREEDSPRLQALEIRTVVDLRGVRERELQPSRGLNADARFLHLPIEPGDLGRRELRESSARDEAAVVRFMHKAYARMITSHGEVFAAFFLKLLEDAPYPLVFHCTAGKDRTGIAAALLLAALRIPFETIVEDYMLSRMGWVATSGDWTVHSGVREEYMDTAFRAMVERSGSVDAYLANVLGVGARERETLERALLVSAPDPAAAPR